MKYCKKCGYKLKEGSLFCSNCGQKIENNNTYLKTESLNQVQDKKQWYKTRVFYILSSFILLLIIIVVIMRFIYNPISADLYEDGVALIKYIDENGITDENSENTKKMIDFLDKYNLTELKDNDFVFVQAVTYTCLSKTLSEASLLTHETNDKKTFIYDMLYEQGKEAIFSKNINKIKKFNNTYILYTDNDTDNEQKPEDSLEIVKGWTWEKDGNYTYIRGRVKNIGDKNIRYFKITAEYMDKDGNVLDTDYTNSVETIRPGNQKEFEIMHRHNDEYESVRIFIDEVRFE